jgi:hypothetical protein
MWIASVTERFRVIQILQGHPKEADAVLNLSDRRKGGESHPYVHLQSDWRAAQ